MRNDLTFWIIFCYLNVACAFSGACEGRYWLGDASRVLENVDDRGKMAFVTKSGPGQAKQNEGREDNLIADGPSGNS
jgi:hypothetical protein